MQVFATEFPARAGTSLDALLAIARKWLVGGPNYPWTADELSSLPENDLRTIKSHDQSVTWGVLRDECTPMAAFRHIWVEDHCLQWTTELVGSLHDGTLWVSVRVGCDAVVPGSPIPRARKPYIVKLLMQEFGGGDDSGLAVADAPRQLALDDLDFVASVMKGDRDNHMPVVYVSVDQFGQPYVDPPTLAKYLGGVGHVLTEPNRPFSFRLRDAVDGRNAYGGAVGIYWPQAAGTMARFIPSQLPPKEMEYEVAETVRAVLCTIRPKDGAAWASVEELWSRMRVDRLRASGEGSLNEFIAAFDSEMKSSKVQLDGANREIGRLKAQMRALQAGAGNFAGLLKPGNEADCFAGELRDIVIDALERAVTTAGEGTRRAHVLADLIAANPVRGGRKERKEAVKRVIATSADVSDSEIKELESLGFTVTDDGKHYKAVYCGDGRYTFAISRTSSDHRAGRNLVSEINRKLFD